LILGLTLVFSYDRLYASHIPGKGSYPSDWIVIVGLVLLLAALVQYVRACFGASEALEEYYLNDLTQAQPPDVSGWKTFFFGAAYIQYHLSRVAKGRTEAGSRAL
jgi:hypothetical protein